MLSLANIYLTQASTISLTVADVGLLRFYCKCRRKPGLRIYQLTWGRMKTYKMQYYTINKQVKKKDKLQSFILRQTYLVSKLQLFQPVKSGSIQHIAEFWNACWCHSELSIHLWYTFLPSSHRKAPFLPRSPKKALDLGRSQSLRGKMRLRPQEKPRLAWEGDFCMRSRNDLPALNTTIQTH